MRRLHTLIVPTVVCLVVANLALPVAQAQVIVNAVEVAERDLAHVSAVIGARPQEGRWWYDVRTGAFGASGGATVGFLPPGLALGGPLRADASGGGDGRYGGVFINGREIHPFDIAGLRRLIGQVIPGRYWVDAAGNFGYEGGGVLGNLLVLAQANGQGVGPRGSAASGCSDASCRNARSWLGNNYFSDGKTGCIVLEGELSC